MDGQQFDRLARVVASGTSRRRVLGMLAAGIASVTTHLTVQKAAAGCTELGNECNVKEDLCCPGTFCNGSVCEQACVGLGEPCKQTGDCCQGDCFSGTCFLPCGSEGQSCSLDVRTAGSELFFCCEDGLECIDGTCTVIEPGCPGEGGYCGAKSAGCCADGFECIEDTCQVPPCGEVGDTDFECCDGLICVDGACVEPEPLCSAEGEPCKADSGCCDGLICLDGGVCGTDVPDPECIEDGDACEVDGDCCAGICCAGFCRDIECCIDEENPNDRCPKGTSCSEGICEGVAEICESDGDCGTGTCCCDDGACSADCCDPAPEEPEEEEENPVTQLPNTGSGANAARRGSWLGAAAIGAAAAFLGGKKLQPERVPADES